MGFFFIIELLEKASHMCFRCLISRYLLCAPAYFSLLLTRQQTPGTPQAPCVHSGIVNPGVKKEAICDVFCALCFAQTQQQIAVQGQQVAQAAEGQTIVYQPVNADGTILQQGRRAASSQGTSGRGFLFIEVFLCSAGILSGVQKVSLSLARTGGIKPP